MNKILHGLGTDHLTSIDNNSLLIHKDILDDFIKLKDLANKDGIDLCIISSFRSFERQKTIWNKKVPLNFSEEDILKSLRWSAMPGFSRHHWGTDLDIADKNLLAQNPDYKILLEPHEYEEGGPFSRLGHWLDNNINQSSFFRPYSKDLGGVAREPWHISHIALSSYYMSTLSQKNSIEFLKSSHCNDIHGIDYLINHFEDLFQKYIINIT